MNRDGDPGGGGPNAGAIAEPNARDLMLLVTTGELNDLVVKSADGAERVIARNVFPAQVGPCPSCSAF